MRLTVFSKFLITVGILFLLFVCGSLLLNNTKYGRQLKSEVVTQTREIEQRHGVCNCEALLDELHSVQERLDRLESTVDKE